MLIYPIVDILIKWMDGFSKVIQMTNVNKHTIEYVSLQLLPRLMLRKYFSKKLHRITQNKGIV